MKLYCDKTRARYAAKRQLAKGSLNAEPKEGVDFEVVEQDGRFAWVVPLSVQGYNDEAARAPERTPPIVACDPGLKPVAVLVPGATAVTTKRTRNPRVLAPVEKRPNVAVGDEAESLAAETAPEWPTSFVPDVENGEIASREYGMLLTRERAVEAAQAAGATDAVITQTGRGMFVWRTSQLDKVWKANAAPKPAAARKEKAAPGERPRRGGSKLDIAEKLLRRPEGATPEEIAAQVDGWDARTAKIRIGTCLKLTRKLPIESAVEEGRGKVYRIAA